jgi:hypothetical protein
MANCQLIHSNNADPNRTYDLAINSFADQNANETQSNSLST